MTGETPNHPARLAILQRSCYVPKQRDDVKSFVPVWFVEFGLPLHCRDPTPTGPAIVSRPGSTLALALYSASKAAMLQIGRVLARDGARRGINVNALCPGYGETAISAHWFATDPGRRRVVAWPRRRPMEPSALDGALLYLASYASAFVTGSALTVDDGPTPWRQTTRSRSAPPLPPAGTRRRTRG